VSESSAKGIALICYVDESCPVVVLGDAARLRQIIVNLLSNAVKFTSDGEILLTVSARPTSEGRLELTATVTDTGIGISSAGVERLFESFSQVDDSTTRVYGGTGLGLVISQRLAEAMDGKVSVTSRPGVGSTFTVELLVDPSGEENDHLALILDLEGLSVLVVDNNATCLRVMSLQLANLGMVPTAVPTPAEALELARSGAHWDVAVVDMMMPGLNGAQLASALHETVGMAHLPVVLVTSVGTRPPGAEAMFAALLAKPVKSASLLRAVSAALTGGPSQDSRERQVPITRAITPLRILLAEDNLVNQRVQQLMLAKLGHQVQTVVNGRLAVAAITARPFDVVLMDVQMPEMDGLEATRRIRAQIPADQQPQIVAMTASALVEDRDACNAAGMDNYLTKPVRATELKAVLTSIAAARVGPCADGSAASPPSDSTPARPPAVDESVLDGLRVQLDDATGDLVAELIDTYQDEGDGQIEQLVTAADCGQTARVATIAHSLRSTSALLGATGLVLLLQGVEKAAREGSTELGPAALQVKHEYERASAALHGRRNAGEASTQSSPAT
jgi:CheY-like chemotaxis protein/HPt (histidine-containing phosphotransfer) domain-containing protein